MVENAHIVIVANEDPILSLKNFKTMSKDEGRIRQEYFKKLVMSKGKFSSKQS